MSTKEEFIQLAADVLSVNGFEMVNASDGDRISAIRNRESSVLVHVSANEMSNGEPLVTINSLAVVNFDTPEPGKMLDLLLTLNKLNQNQIFGTWYLSLEPMVIVLEHSLMVNHMTPEEFVTTVGMIEATADEFDNQLSKYLDGQTAQEMLLESASKVRRGQRGQV
jgi:hypothetical protein